LASSRARRHRLDHSHASGFCGSYSIKSVLPAVAPDLSYDDLEIGNGAGAARRRSLWAAPLISSTVAFVRQNI